MSAAAVAESPAPPKVAAITIVRKRIVDLRPHPKNPRKHPKKGSNKWAAMVESLRFDYFDPIVWNARNDYLVSGHFRLSVLTDEGYDEADCSKVDYDEATHEARMVAANELLGAYDGSHIELLREIERRGDAGKAGMAKADLLKLLKGPEDIDDDDDHAGELLSEADKIQRIWQVEAGQRFEIGEGSRLICGDCTAPEHWTWLLRGGEADMIWIDPPYNVDHGSAMENRKAHKERAGQKPRTVPEDLINDKLADGEFAQALLGWLEQAYAMTKPGGAIYMAHAESKGLVFRQAFQDAGWEHKQTIIWAKNHFALGRQDYQWIHEPILYGWKPGAAHYWQGGFAQTTIWDEKPDLAKLEKKALIRLVRDLWNDKGGTVQCEDVRTEKALHPTIKPINLVARHIWNNSERGAVVGELFAGSGTTVVAAESIGRRCVATELEPKYAAVTLQRARDRGLRVEKIDG